MKKVTVGKMDLFDLLRRLVFPALEDNLDRAFPEFGFQEASNGWWVARDAPIEYREYGHVSGKLVGRGWGFRSLEPGKPVVFWLSFVNKGKLPKVGELRMAVQSLAKRVRISFDWDVNEGEAREAQERIRQILLPEAFSVHAQGELWSNEGAKARKYLEEFLGVPENLWTPLEMGFCTTVGRTKRALETAGFSSMWDHEAAGAAGFYQSHWEDRLVGPWRDVFGRRIVNFWAYRFPFDVEGEPRIDYLRRMTLETPLGSKEVLFGLHLAYREKQKNLVLVESPLSAVVPFARGMRNPCFVATGGSLTGDQVPVLEKFLKQDGSLTLNLDYVPKPRRDIHAKTHEALDLLRDISFPVYVVDPVEMGRIAAGSERVDPVSFIKKGGMQGYAELLRKRVPAMQYTPSATDTEGSGLFG